MSAVLFSNESFEVLYSRLLELDPPLLPPSKPTNAGLTDGISSQYVHPAIEAALHLLNNDLASAHFLVRHMEAAPAFEAMYLHGILHRIEGDYDNSRAWYRDVKSSDVFQSVWKRENEAFEFIDAIELLKKKKEGSIDELRARSIQEIKGVVDFCVSKFGSGQYQDARVAYVKADEHKNRLGQEMVSGGKGYREF